MVDTIDVVQYVWSALKVNPGVLMPTASVRSKTCIFDWKWSRVMKGP